MAMLDSPALFYTGPSIVISVPQPSEVVRLTPDGKLMRGDKEVKDLPREELLKVIDELVDLFRKR